MNSEMMRTQIRALCQAPRPEGKEAFFRKVKAQGLLHRRPRTISQWEFAAGQFLYIEKWVWALSVLLLLLITAACRRSPGNEPFALTPFLAAGILAQTGRSFRWKMAEMEHAARFSLRSVLLARLFWVGVVNTAGLMLVVLLVRPCFSYSLIRVFLYMMVPYLTAAWLGSVYERKQRADHGWGSVLICLLSSAAFAAAPAFLAGLYEERLTVLWAALFITMAGGLPGSIRNWIARMEEPVWN